MNDSIQQIINDAVKSEHIKVSELLRRIKLLSYDSNSNEDFYNWITNELEGYEEGEIPDYREVQGEPFGFDIDHNKWERVVWQNSKIPESMSKMKISDSVSTLESFQNDNNTLRLEYSNETQMYLQKNTGVNTNFYLFITPNTLNAVLSGSRNKLIDYLNNLDAPLKNTLKEQVQNYNNLRNAILQILYNERSDQHVRIERLKDELKTQGFQAEYESIRKEIKYLEEEQLLKVTLRVDNYPEGLAFKITAKGIDLVEDPEEFNKLFTVNVNNFTNNGNVAIGGQSQDGNGGSATIEDSNTKQYGGSFFKNIGPFIKAILKWLG
jgi:hypothetical protein